MINKIEVETFHGAVAEATKEFEVRFFLKSRKSHVSLWFSSDMSKLEIINTLLTFVQKMLSVMEN